MTERDKERGDGRDPLDEEAAWAEIVAGYGEAPRAPGDAPEPPRETGEERDGDGLVPGVWHPDAVPDHGSGGSAAAARADAAGTADTAASGDADGPTTGGTREGAPGNDRAGTSPPDTAEEPGATGGATPAEANGGDGPAGEGTARPGEVNRLDADGQWNGPGPRDWAPEEEEGEGRFIPPEPPPLPETDMITRFAWLGVVGGPVLLVGCAVLGVDMTWWLTTAGVGGFLGGMATLVLGMRDDPDDEWTDPGSGAVV